MKRNILFISLIIGAFISCKSKEAKFEIFKKQALDEKAFEIDTLNLEISSFSGKGFFRILNNQVCFFDESYYLLSFFDGDGKFITNKLGLGRNENEIGGFTLFAQISGNRNLFFDNEYMFKNYDVNFKRTQMNYQLHWASRKKYYETFDADNPDMYDFSWDFSRYSEKWLPVDSKDNLYMPMNVIGRISPNVNKFDNYKEYYANLHTVGIINSKTGLLESVFGQFPETYQKGKNLTLFAYNYLYIKKDSLFVTYAADPYIYVYDPDHNPAYAFGIPGKNMNTNYPEVKNYDEYSALFRSSQKTYGYYTSVFTYDNLVFRSYTKDSTNVGGLQIYKDKILVKDVNVPKKFNVIGKIGDWFYADGLVDELTNKLAVYKFKLK